MVNHKVKFWTSLCTGLSTPAATQSCSLKLYVLVFKSKTDFHASFTNTVIVIIPFLGFLRFFVRFFGYLRFFNEVTKISSTYFSLELRVTYFDLISVNILLTSCGPYGSKLAMITKFGLIFQKNSFQVRHGLIICTPFAEGNK